MPLKVMDVVESRLRMINDVRDRRLSPREVAERHGVSKSQLYEWLCRYERDGVEGLVPRSRRPQRSPRQVAAEVEDEIVRWRKLRPRWGAKKIRAMLERDGWRPVPAVSTVQQVLRRRGFVAAVRRSREPAEGWCSFVRPYPNDLWHVDATCHRLANGRPFWVIDLIDDHSRFLLATHVCVSPTCETGWAALRQTVAACGLPRQLLSDNGLNFTGRLHHVTVAFERQVRAAGIELIHSRPYHPETLGKHERQHRTQNEWIADHGAPRSLRAAQTLLDAYRADYNTARPHEAIGQHFPVELYEPGQPVELPAVELAPADPYPPGCLKRRVDHSGRVGYSRTAFPLDRRWAGITVGLIRRGAHLEAYYGAALIDTFIVGDLHEPTPRGRRPTTKSVRHVSGTQRPTSLRSEHTRCGGSERHDQRHTQSIAVARSCISAPSPKSAAGRSQHHFGDICVVTSDERCGEILDGVQCQLRLGHVPEAHVAGRRDGAGRRSWLLGRDYDIDVADAELEWASGFPQP